MSAAFMLTGCLAGAPEQFFSKSYVCNALGDTEGGSGIKGTIHYLDPTQVSQGYSGVNDFLTKGHKPSIDFYMGRLATPTRPFSEGFRLANGDLVQDLQGNDLVEYFAFHLTSRIQLPIGYADRYVQFALISDDGARLIVHRKNADGTTSRVVNVNNDGDHATRMGCGTAPVKVSAFEQVEIEIDYYQGPRYHIALTMLWRDWPSNPNDPQCNKTGSGYFWDSTTTPSTPQAPFNDVMTRWSIVPSQVFIGDGTSPCS